MNLKEFCEELENDIKQAYEREVTLLDAEKLSAKFLHAQMVVSKELRTASLDARMRKSGLKSIKANILLSEVQKSEKKPADSLLTAMVDSNEIVAKEEAKLYTAEVEAEELERYYDLFGQGHIYFRQISKGVQG